jgi:glutamyl-tRNA synthetase
MNESDIRVRYAPSPTGYPHVGNIRTALFNWLYAKHSGGSFIVRIEDTDQSRSVEGAIENILESLQWLGIDWDEGPIVGGDFGPYLQSERLNIYQEAVDKLIEQGDAYYCICSPDKLASMRKEQQKLGKPPGYDRLCRSAGHSRKDKSGLNRVVRFATPIEGPPVTTDDLIRGEVNVELPVIDDFVILKSDGFPTYHLANVVDDHHMQISHVMRAEEWLPSTPRHLLLYKALGFDPPIFAHLPMILGSDRAKLSKRHGATTLLEYRDEGYLPEAMLNFLVLLGWSLDDKTEVIPLTELIENFSLSRIGKSPAIFDITKLEWMNGIYIRSMPVEQLAEHIKGYNYHQKKDVSTSLLDNDYIKQIVELVQDRVRKVSSEEIWSLTSFLLVDDLNYSIDLNPKGLGKSETASAIRSVISELESTKDFNVSTLEPSLRELAKELNLSTRHLFGAIRLAVTGSNATPPLFETMVVIGRDRVIKRLHVALAILEEMGSTK